MTIGPSQNARTARAKAKGLAHPVCPPAPAVSSTRPSLPTTTAFSAWRTDATSANTRQPPSCRAGITRSGLPTLAITISTLWRSSTATSSITRPLERWTIRFGQIGGSLCPAACSASSTRRRICVSQASSSSVLRQFTVGNAPMMPLLHAATTSSMPETRNIGAAISGSVIRAASAAGRLTERIRTEWPRCAPRSRAPGPDAARHRW